MISDEKKNNPPVPSPIHLNDSYNRRSINKSDNNKRRNPSRPGNRNK